MNISPHHSALAAGRAVAGFAGKIFAFNSLILGLCLGLVLVLGAGCNIYADLDEVELHYAEQDAVELDTNAEVPDVDPDLVEEPDLMDDPDLRDDASGNPDSNNDPSADTTDTTDTPDSPDASGDECDEEIGSIRGDCMPEALDELSEEFEHAEDEEDSSRRALRHCNEGTTCRLETAVTEREDQEFRSNCLPSETIEENPDLSVEGEACGRGSECVEGLDCIAVDNAGAVCRRMCELKTGTGCDSELEYCVNPKPDMLSGLGFCVTLCGQNGSTDGFIACPAGQSCVEEADLSVPGDPDSRTLTCHANNMRCVSL